LQKGRKGVRWKNYWGQEKMTGNVAEIYWLQGIQVFREFCFWFAIIADLDNCFFNNLLNLLNLIDFSGDLTFLWCL